jgi:site-specific DNA-methyltransferase (adenine-specific)
MTTCEVIGAATLYHGDCRDIMPGLQAHAIFTDLPYAPITHANTRTNKVGVQPDAPCATFDGITGQTFDHVMGLCLDVAEGWILATCDLRHAAPWIDTPHFMRMGVLVKRNPTPLICGDRPAHGFEPVLILHARKVKPQWWGIGAAVWTTNVVQHAEVPTQKPVELYMDFVMNFTRQMQIVLDPFMGSGTTGVAAVKLARRFIGIEREAAHFDVACQRIENAQRKKVLFHDYVPYRARRLNLEGDPQCP